jgi:hypothetical protein
VQPSQPTSFAVVKLSIATDHMAIAGSQPSQPAKQSVAKLSIATVAAVATNHVAVAKLSIATIAAVATDQVVSVAMPLSQPMQPSQPVNYLGTDLSGRKKVVFLGLLADKSRAFTCRNVE